MPKTAQKRTQPKRRAHRPAPRKTAQPSQALVVRAPGPKPWLLQPEELTILKNAVCKGATDEELKFCLAVARRRELDPFRGQIWFVPRRDRNADDGEGGTGAKVWIPVVSIHGLCHVGARDHKDYGSFSEPEFGPTITVEWRWKGQGQAKKLQVPEWARIEAYKKGSAQPTVGKVWWSEIYPNIDYAPMVRQMPRRMLAKCAQAQAIRLAYPETGGLYIQEEMQETTPPQFTPEGRAIVMTSPAEERYKEREKEGLEHLTPAQREVVTRRMAEVEARKNAPIDIQPPRTEMPKTDAPALYYRYYRESDTWKIGGAGELIKAHLELLNPLWQQNGKAFVANAKQLGHLIREFELRKVPFHEAGAVREPGQE